MKLTDRVLKEFQDPKIAGPIVNEMATELLTLRIGLRNFWNPPEILFTNSDIFGWMLQCVPQSLIGEKE